MTLMSSLYFQEEAVSCYCSASHTDNNYSTDEHEHDSIREGACGVGIAHGGLQLSDSGADLSECGGDIQYTSSSRHEDWERYWSANGERIIWQSWIAKYGEYINSGYCTAFSESNGALPEDGPAIQMKDPPDDFSKSKTSQCSSIDEQHSPFHGQESDCHPHSSTFHSSFQKSFSKDEQDLSRYNPSFDSVETDVELPSKNLLDNEGDDGYSGPRIDKTDPQDSIELRLPAIIKTNAESKDENLLISPAGETPETEAKPDMLMCNSDINPADTWSPLSPSSSDDSSGDGSADDNVVAGSVANTALTSDSMTNVTKITVSSLDFSCGDTEDSVNSSSMSSSSSAGCGSAPCTTDEADQYWQELWKKHFNEQYCAHYNAFLAWEQKEGNEETEADTVETSDTSRPLFQVGEESSCAKQNSFHELNPNIGNVSASCVKDDTNLNFVDNYYSANDMPLTASALVTNEHSCSTEIELASEYKSCYSNKESERNLSLCSATMTEHTETLSSEENFSGVRKMELSVGTDQSFRELHQTKEQLFSELERMCGDMKHQTPSADEDSSSLGKLELNAGTDHSFDELDHKNQCLISVSSSGMVVEEKEYIEGFCSITNEEESTKIVSSQSHLPPVPKRVSGRRRKSRYSVPVL